jgi:eukaryotic-like serine/threonine-protein kinase
MFQKSPFPQAAPSFSPDGRWLAYCSTESGEQKVYVVPLPGPGGKTQVSPGGGCVPRWRKDGKELSYLSADNEIMSAEVKTSGVNFEVGEVKPLFETRVYRYNGGYDVTADGQKFIVAYEAGQPNAVITLVENWDAGMK